VLEPDAIEVNSVLPNRGETTGGLLVEIVGLGFEPGMSVSSTIARSSRTRSMCSPTAASRSHTPAAWDSPACWSWHRRSVSACSRTASSITSRSPSPWSSRRVVRRREARRCSPSAPASSKGRRSVSQRRDGRSGHRPRTQARDTAPPLPRATYAVTVSNFNGSATLPPHIPPGPGRSPRWPLCRIRRRRHHHRRGRTGFVAGSVLTVGGQVLAATANAPKLSSAPPRLPPYRTRKVPSTSALPMRTDPRPARRFRVRRHRRHRARSLPSPLHRLVDGGRDIDIVGAGFDDPAPWSRSAAEGRVHRAR